MPRLRLHLNENTAGCSPAVLAALRSIERRDASEYPDYAGATTRCEQWLGVPCATIAPSSMWNDAGSLIFHPVKSFPLKRFVQPFSIAVG